MKDNDIANRKTQGTKNTNRRLLSTVFGEECQVLVLEKKPEKYRFLNIRVSLTM